MAAGRSLRPPVSPDPRSFMEYVRTNMWKANELIVEQAANPYEAQLALGAVENGQVLVRSGNTLIGAAGVPSSLAHNMLSATHSDTLTASVVRGDLIVGNATPKWSRLAKGTEAYYLRAGASDVGWSALAAADLTGTTLPASIVTSSLTTVGTLGSLAVAGAITAASLVLGTDPGGTTDVRVGNGLLNHVGTVSGGQTTLGMDVADGNIIATWTGGTTGAHGGSFILSSPGALLPDDPVLVVRGIYDDAAYTQQYGSIAVQMIHNGAAMPSGHRLGVIGAQGWDGGRYMWGARFDFVSAEAWHDDYLGTEVHLLQWLTGGGRGYLSTTWLWTGSGHYRPSDDNIYDVGEATKRIHSVYAGTSLVAPVLDSGAATSLLLKYNGTTVVTVGSATAGIAGTLAATSTTTPQLSVRYDGSNRLDVAVSSAGAVTFGATGASAGVRFNDAVGIGSAPASNASLYVLAPATAQATTTQRGIAVDYIGNASATAGIFALDVRAQTAAAAFTAVNLTSIYVRAPVVGAGSAITTSYALFVEAATAAGTNYGLYVLGAASRNRIEGVLGVGGDASTNVGLYLRGTRTASSGGSYGIVASPVLKTAANSDVLEAFTARSWHVDNTGTYTGVNVASFVAANPTVDAGTIANLYGMNILPLSVATTSGTYALYIGAVTNGALNSAIFTNAGYIRLGDRVSVGGTSGTTDSALYVVAPVTALTGTSNRGITVDLVGNAAATASVRGLSVRGQSAVAAYTLTALYGIYVHTALAGAGSTVTTGYGLYIEDQTAGATNWALYAAGTTASFLGGSLRVNKTLGIGNSAVTNVGIQLSTSLVLSGSASQNGALIYAQGDATATNLTGIRTAIYTAAAVHTVTAGYGLFVGDAVVGAGSAITTLYGLYVNPLTAGGTNWAIYTAGATASYFGGAVTLASTLHVDGLITANAGLTVASGQTLTVTGATVTGLTAASVGAGTFPTGAYSFTTSVASPAFYGALLDSNAAADLVLKRNAVAQLTLGSLLATFAGYIKTAAPTGGTADQWKLGTRVAATVALDTTQYLQVDVNGTLYKVGIVS